MKKVIIPAIAIMLFATACEKNVLDHPGTPVTGSNAGYSSNREFVDYNYTIYKDPTTGEYSCPTPKVDCSKISPNPTKLSAIDEAITKGRVKTFFNAENAEENFPYLYEQPDVLAGLKSGEYTMVRRSNSAGEILYIVISSTENPDAFNTGIYTTLVRNGN